MVQLKLGFFKILNAEDFTETNTILNFANEKQNSFTSNSLNFNCNLQSYDDAKGNWWKSVSLQSLLFSFSSPHLSINIHLFLNLEELTA